MIDSQLVGYFDLPKGGWRTSGQNPPLSIPIQPPVLQSLRTYCGWVVFRIPAPIKRCPVPPGPCRFGNPMLCTLQRFFFPAVQALPGNICSQQLWSRYPSRRLKKYIWGDSQQMGSVSGGWMGKLKSHPSYTVLELGGSWSMRWDFFNYG